MSHATQWSGVRGSLSLEAFKPGPRRLWEDSWNVVLPKDIQDVLYDNLPSDADYCEIATAFTSDGYFQPAQLYGPPEKCYPEEGGDERTLDEVILKPGLDGLEFPDVVPSAGEQHQIFEALIDEVNDAELEYDDSIDEP